MEPAKDSAPADISGAYKRKEYGWFIFYITVVVISARLAGIIGSIVSILVATALYKTVKNPAYSTTKKTVLSSAYVIGGIILTLVAATLLTYALARIWPQAVIPKMLASDPPLTSAAFTSSTTSSLLSAASANTSFPDLEAPKYTDAKLHFSIGYPNGWHVDTSGTNGNVEFDDPSSNEVALETVTADNVQGYGYDFQTVVRGVLHNFKEFSRSECRHKDPRRGEYDSEWRARVRIRSYIQLRGKRPVLSVPRPLCRMAAFRHGVQHLRIILRAVVG
jgi:hypothetical protein